MFYGPFIMCVFELQYVLRLVNFCGLTMPSSVQTIVILNPITSFVKNNNPGAHGKAH